MRAIAGDERTVPERAVLALSTVVSVILRYRRSRCRATLRDGAAHAPLFRAADQGVALDCA